MTAFPMARWPVSLTAVALLTSCAHPPMSLPGPLVYERTPQVASGSIIQAPSEQAGPPTTRITAVPGLPTQPAALPTRPRPASVASAADEELVSMALEQTPLPLFIQILYGNVLKRPFSVDGAVNARQDLVTFKTSAPISRQLMAQLGVTLLRGYGLAVQDLEGLVRIVPDNAQSSAPPPVLQRGRSLPDAPESLRPVFQHVELEVVRTGDVTQWLRQILGNRVNIQEDGNRNGFLLAGTVSDIRIALDLIRSLDQPKLRGSVAKRITPAYMGVADFSARLSEMLTAQGYAVSIGAAGNTPIIFIPIPAINALMAFASTEQNMDQVVRWAMELDRPAAVKPQSGLYTYPVKYADAVELARTLSEILGGGSTPTGLIPGAAPGNAAAAVGAQSQNRASPQGGRVVVNTATNTLIFRGTSADEYQQIMALMRDIDRPVKSAMIEVVVAELTLGGTQTLGIDWRVPTQSVDSGKYQVAAGTLGGVGVGGGGFNFQIANSAGAILARLNALALNDQARVLSNPKVLARNGETASIQVGQEVPIITSQQSTGSGGLFGNPGVIQSVAYRSTGVILRVRPVINAGNRLDLELTQEVSSAAQTSTGVGASPTISTRRIETKLSLRDGSTVLMGGLISRNQSDSNVGIPILKDIPGIGSVFRSESASKNQTEMLVMITPYVVSDDFEAESISEALQNSFGDWARPLRRARVVPTPELITGPAAAASAPSGAATNANVPSGTGTGGPATSNMSPPAPAAAKADGPSGPAGPLSPLESPPVLETPAQVSQPLVPPPVNAPAPTPPSPAKPAPAPVTPAGKEVTDRAVKDEIRQLIKKPN